MSSDKQIGVAVIATGSRGTHVMENLLRDSGRNVKIVAVYDQNREYAGRAVAKWDEPSAKICDSYLEAINTAGVDWVMIFSPNVYHKEHILAAFVDIWNTGENIEYRCQRKHPAGAWRIYHDELAPSPSAIRAAHSRKMCT